MTALAQIDLAPMTDLRRDDGRQWPEPPQPAGHRKDFGGSTVVIRKAKTPKRCDAEISDRSGYYECGRAIRPGDLYASWAATPWHDVVGTGHWQHHAICSAHPVWWGI